MITIILVLVAAVGGFIAGVLVGRANAKAVTAVVNTANTALSATKTVVDAAKKV